MGRGCDRSWHELASGGFVCAGRGFNLGPHPLGFEAAPQAPALADALPYRYAKNIAKTAMQFWRLPTRVEVSEAAQWLSAAPQKELHVGASGDDQPPAPELKPVQPIQIPEWGELNRERAEAGLRIVDRQLAGNEFVAGPRFTVADITLAHQLLGMPGATGIAVPDDCRHRARWLEAVVQRPSVASTQPPDYGLIQRIRPSQARR